MSSIALYTFACSWPLFLSALIDSIKNRKLYIILAFIPYIMISALRGFRVGTDTEQFTTIFQSIIKAGWNQFGLFRYEPLFLAFCKLLGNISTDPHILIMGSSLLMGLCAIYATQQLSKSPIFSCCLYGTTLFFFTNLCVMRQGIATSIILAGIPALFQGRKKKFIIFAIVGFLFHYSSIFFSLICLLAYKKEDKDYDNYNKAITFAGGSIVLLTCIMILPQIALYMNEGTYSGYAKNVSYLKFTANLLIMAPVLIFLIRHTFHEFNAIQHFCCVIFFTELILLLGATINAAVSRMAFFFHSTLYLLIPMVGENWDLKKKKIIHESIFLFFIVYTVLMSQILLHEWGLFPYEFMWNESLILKDAWVDYLL